MKPFARTVHVDGIAHSVTTETIDGPDAHIFMNETRGPLVLGMSLEEAQTVVTAIQGAIDYETKKDFDCPRCVTARRKWQFCSCNHGTVQGAREVRLIQAELDAERRGHRSLAAPLGVVNGGK